MLHKVTQIINGRESTLFLNFRFVVCVDVAEDGLTRVVIQMGNLTEAFRIKETIEELPRSLFAT